MATVVGLFDNFTSAQSAVEDLVKHGSKRYEISLLANASASEYARYFSPDATPEQEKALTTGEGVGVGTVVGAVTGIVVGLASLVIPGIGPVIAAGPLIAGLTGGTVGVVAGAATGGVVAALINSDVPEAEAQVYAESIRRGGTLVLARTPETEMATIQSIMQAHNAVDVVQRRTAWQSDSPAINDLYHGYPVGGTTFDSFLPAYRQHYATHYADTPFTFEHILSFYRYGYDLATDPRYASSAWDELEDDARRLWEERNPKDFWGSYRDAVRYGWESARHVREAEAQKT
ncbi:MAG: hypothetical protein ACYDBJ_12475 [Aggregatilineales bacterium]